MEKTKIKTDNEIELTKAKRRLREGKKRVSLMVFLGRSKDKINAKRLANYNFEKKVEELEKAVKNTSKK